MLENLFIQILFILIIIETVLAFVPYFEDVEEVNPITSFLKKHISDSKLARGFSGIMMLMIVSFMFILLKGAHWSIWLIGCVFYAWLIGCRIFIWNGISASDVKASTFGVDFQAYNFSGYNVTVAVDVIQVKIHYEY